MEKQTPLTLPIFELVLCLARAVDLVSPLIADHHRRTAHIAYGLGMQMKQPEAEIRNLVIAAALHDVGGLTCHDRLLTLDFEYQNPYGHAVLGYLLLKTFQPFEEIASLVRFHHIPWQNGQGAHFAGQPVPMKSHLLQLADRVAVLIDPSLDILTQVDDILSKIRAQSGERFIPEQVETLELLAEKESFWLDTIHLSSLDSLSRRLAWPDLHIDDDEFLGLSNLFRRIIDFRSQFTAFHSAGVAASSETLAHLCGFSKAECHTIHLAGLLHDLGKLAVPTEILEKPAKLSPEEFTVMRRHTYYTYYLLEPLNVMDVIRVWGSFHHERMDGHGYPFHLDQSELPRGSRIVAVADMFTALTEDRPYRRGMPVKDALQIIEDAAAQERIDKEIVTILANHLEEIDGVRSHAQMRATKEYQQFLQEAALLTGQKV